MSELILTAPPSQEVPTVLKWCGSKGQLASHLSSLLLPMLERGGSFLEPFLGSAAVFLSLRARGWRGEAILSDVLEPLVAFYSTLTCLPGNIYRVLHEIERGYQACKGADQKRAYYEEKRQQLNQSEAGLSAYRAGLFLWINHRCFNGLWRTGKGKFNTSWGGEDRSYLPSLARLLEAKEQLTNAWLYCSDFAWTISQAKAGDVIYADPPYAVGYRYYAGSFDEAHQTRLASCLKVAWEQGVSVVASNSDTPKIRELYAWADIASVPMRYYIGSLTRKKVAQEVIIVARGAQ